MATVLVVTLYQQPAAPADTTRGRPCKVLVDSVGRQGQRVEVRAKETNVFAGGGVLAHCEGTSTTLSADSVAWFAGVKRFDMIGQRNIVHIRDTTLTLDATTATYYLAQERLEAHRNVVAVNRTTGTVLRGPNLTYYRAAPGIRDTIEMYSSGRPTIDYHATADSGEPYIIVADRVRFKGNDKMWGGGRVTIDRSDFAAQGDSMQLDQPTGFGVLVGKPAMEGKGARPYKLTGTRIELGLAGRELRRVKALGEGVATGSDWRLTADTIDLRLERRKLQRAFAWGPKDSVRSRAVSTTTTIRADSLALDLPDEVLTEARAFGHAFSTSKKDSTKNADVDWIAGDSLIARWTQVPDSASAPKTRLHELISRNNARALTHVQSEHDTAGPSINYSRGTVIRVVLKRDKVDTVTVTGHADGVQLEHRPPAPDTTKHPTPTPPNR
ncbi:MAG: hypothetical protein DMD33_06015 [Gemmatimonadetes bacterium]|nr:MAG: hypothetical protein DMD33_06015 [Gemmatimonadota bacterium]